MPLGEVPILEVVLRQLGRFGFTDVTIITGYLTELIEAFCRDGSRFGTNIRYVRETAPLGTAGGLALLEKPAEPVLVLNGDILTTLDMGAMFRFHQRKRAAATIASYTRHVKIDFGVLDFDADPDHLAGYREKPEFSFQVSMGLYILEPCAWDHLEPDVSIGMPDLLESLRVSGRDVCCYREACEWLDIGRPDDYAAASALFEARRAEFLGENVLGGYDLRDDSGHARLSVPHAPVWAPLSRDRAPA
jgi:NDP-sugar pyrophosphorylase family protein